MSFNWIKKFGNGLSSTSDIVTPAQNASATQINIETGIPASQQEDPAGGGEYVKRAEFNGLLQALSYPLFERNGGKQVTFDADYSTQNNGYAIGTILWCASNKTFQISLQNNNNKNFVTNPSYVNDGTWWKNLASVGEFPDITDNATTGSVNIGGRVVGGTQELKGLSADGNTATIGAYGNSGGSGTGSAFIGVLNSSFIPVSGFQINTTGRPYVAGNIAITNPYNTAIIKDLTSSREYDHLIVTITPVVHTPLPTKYAVTVNGGVTCTVTGGIPQIPAIAVNSFGLSAITHDNVGGLHVIQSHVVNTANVVANIMTNQIEFVIGLTPLLPDGNYNCTVNLTFLAN